MIEKITLDLLTEDSVSVKRQQYVDVGGVEYAIGDPHRRAYVNDSAGRAVVIAELPQAQAEAVMAVWGAEPTVVVAE